MQDRPKAERNGGSNNKAKNNLAHRQRGVQRLEHEENSELVRGLRTDIFKIKIIHIVI